MQIKPKIKLNSSCVTYAVTYSEHDPMTPYRLKVISQLKLTALNPDLIHSIEAILYHKATLEIEKLRCNREFDVYKKHYMSTCRHIIENLKINNSIANQPFIELMNSGTIPIEDLVNLNPQDMHSDRWKHYIEKKNHNINEQLKEPEATTDMFQCGRCKKTKCTYYESQDRSADEPMTIHITCCNCGNRWKQ